VPGFDNTWFVVQKLGEGDKSSGYKIKEAVQSVVTGQRKLGIREISWLIMKGSSGKRLRRPWDFPLAQKVCSVLVTQQFANNTGGYIHRATRKGVGWWVWR